MSRRSPSRRGDPAAAPADPGGVGEPGRIVAGEALSNYDDLVQLLTAAKLALALDDPTTAAAAVDTALTTARRALTELLLAQRPPSGTQPPMVRTAAARSAERAGQPSEGDPSAG